MRKTVLVAVMVSGLAMMPVMAQAQTATQAAETSPSVAPARTPLRIAAETLANTLIPASSVSREVDKLLGTMATQAFASDPSLKALNAEYPGADRVFVDAMRPIMLEELETYLPDYVSATATFFEGNFTLTELRELTTFWQSADGQAFLSSLHGNMNYDAISKDIVGQIGDGTDGFSVSDDALKRDTTRAVTTSIGALTPAQRTAIARFSLTPTGRKMARLTPEKQKIDAAWANRQPSARAISRLEKELPPALLGFMAAEDEKRKAGK